MKVYTYSEARQSFATVLEEANRTGAVRIRRKDGRIFVLRPEKQKKSPLDVAGVDLGLSRSEILTLIKEGRRKA